MGGPPSPQVVYYQQPSVKPPDTEDPEVRKAREREAAALRKQRGRQGTLLAGATLEGNTPGAGGALTSPIGDTGGRLLGS